MSYVYVLCVFVFVFVFVYVYVLPITFQTYAHAYNIQTKGLEVVGRKRETMGV